jgi:hypothetical protein
MRRLGRGEEEQPAERDIGSRSDVMKKLPESHKIDNEHITVHFSAILNVSEKTLNMSP